MESHLQYGSIIRLISSNDDYKDKLFFVNYIGNNEIQLTDNKLFNTFSFKISNGQIDDENVEKIEVLYTPPEGIGYAKINGLVHNPEEPVVVDITFITEVPFIVTGEIISLEEDMIEIKPYNENINENLFIDFHYGGIDQELQIGDISIRYDDIRFRNRNDTVNQGDLDEDRLADSDDEEFNEYIAQGEQQTETKYRRGEVVGYVSSLLTQQQNRSYAYIYSIEQQMNDYINSYLYKHENVSEHEKRKLIKEINKYVELRKKYSDFTGDKIKKKRLPANQLLEQNKNLKNTHILLPVTSNVLKIFTLIMKLMK